MSHFAHLGIGRSTVQIINLNLYVATSNIIALKRKKKNDSEWDRARSSSHTISGGWDFDESQQIK